MSFDQLVPYIAGPGGAIVVCVLVGWAVYRLLVHVGAPLLKSAVDRHLAQVDEMNQRHSEEHRRIIEALNTVRPCGFVQADS
jgi:hypothetical protein